MPLQHHALPRRLGGLLLIVALAAPTLAHAADDDAAPAPEPEPLNEQRVIEAVSVRVQSIHMSMDVRFDELMHPQHREHRMHVALVIEHDPELEVRGLEGLELATARTSMGERLKQPQEAMHQHQRHGQRFWRHHDRMPPDAWGMLEGVGRPQLHTHLELNYPTRSADRFEQLAGKVQLRVAGGKVRRAVLGPYQQIRGRRLRIADHEHGRLRIDREARHGPGHVGVQMPPAFADAVKEVSFYSAQNRKLRADHSGQHMEGENVTLIYRVALDDDGQVVIAFHDQVETVDVPFDLAGVALPTPPEGDRGLAQRNR